MELILAASIIAGTPLILAILGEIITERAGILNLGVEGMMLMGAIGGFATAFYTKNAFLTIIVAMLSAGLGALIFGILTISLKTNQTVTGLALTIFGTGISSFFGEKFIGKTVPEAVKNVFAVYKIPVLGDIPFIGNIFFNQSSFVYLSYIIVIMAGIYVYKTKWGLYLTSVGENPSAADSAGINVTRYKYIHVLIGGAMCGLAGAFLSIVYVPAWQDKITSGRGWIAVALVIFCKWNPFRSFIAAYLFGGLSIIGFRLQSYGIHVSQYLVEMLPYAMTIAIIILTSLKSTKSLGPKSLGVSYFREDR